MANEPNDGMLIFGGNQDPLNQELNRDDTYVIPLRIENLGDLLNDATNNTIDFTTHLDPGDEPFEVAVCFMESGGTPVPLNSSSDIGDLNNVDVVSVEPSDGDVLIWDSGSGTWGPGDHGTLGGLGDDDHPQYPLLTTLASTANGDGASLIGIEDALGIIAAGTVEGALAENRTQILSIQTVQAGRGDLADLDTVGTTEIDDDAVTYAKIQNVSATDKVLGRETAGSGVVEEITCNAAGRKQLALESPALSKLVWDDLDHDDQFASATAGSGSANNQQPGGYSWLGALEAHGVIRGADGGGGTSGDGGMRYKDYFAYYAFAGAKFYFRVITNNISGCLYRVGLTDQNHGATSDLVNGLYLELDTTTSSNWYGCTASASSRTKADTGIAATAQIGQWFGIEYVSTSSVKFYDCGTGTFPLLIEDLTADLTNTTNIPSSTGTRDYAEFVQSIGNSGSGEKSCMMDVFAYERIYAA